MGERQRQKKEEAHRIRAKKHDDAAVHIQSVMRRRQASQRFAAKRTASIQVQKVIRRKAAMEMLVAARKAALILQCTVRRGQARSLATAMREQKQQRLQEKQLQEELALMAAEEEAHREVIKARKAKAAAKSKAR